MSAFIQIPKLHIGRKDLWILDDVLVYQSDLLGRDIWVPEMFESDLASIPWWARWLIAVNGKHRPAAIVHDFLYSKRGVLLSGQVDRRKADKIFLEAMEVLNVKSWKRRAMYRAVRIGGWTQW